MDIIHTISDLRRRLNAEPTVALVPTMGHLHDGHIDLIRLAKPHAACLVASIFVNRLQFGPQEDYSRYPRTLAEDCERLKQAGCSVVFAPVENEIYPETQTVTVEPSALQHELEGAFRPGHFRGVATVVLKLFNMVQPQLAIFGKKDYQQYLVLREMVQQLALPITIIPAETVRAADGLALSSRNSYLSAEERAEAPELYRALQFIAECIRRGESPEESCQRGQQRLDSRHWTTDYFSVRSARDLRVPTPHVRELVILAASRLGRTRLIDNLEVTR
ncbi:MAG: pantoate--beta-alanine ligase [Ferrovum sp.]|nr:pantoate--beta-alanine ligase [Ferrovum sp.]NDU87737.1 pantoate--beta-alanine ligase [Ferrovum sp.]